MDVTAAGGGGGSVVTAGGGCAGLAGSKKSARPRTAMLFLSSFLATACAGLWTGSFRVRSA